MRYDENGYVINHIKGMEMRYDSRGHLAKVKLGRNVIEYFYDHEGRLISRKNSESITQFFYGYEGKPHLLSHLYKPHEGSLTTLVYGPDDRLIFMAQDAEEYYVVTDRLGSPLLLLTPQGLVVKEMTRTPYGELTYDSNQSLDVPLGFQGGLFDSLLNLVHFQVSFLITCIGFLNVSLVKFINFEYIFPFCCFNFTILSTKMNISREIT